MITRRFLLPRFSAAALLVPVLAGSAKPADKPPTAAEQAAALMAVRDYALNYAKHAPDYIANQTMAEKNTTYSVEGDAQQYRTIEAQVGVLDHQEVGIVGTIDGGSANVDVPKALAQFFALGEFGGLLARIFTPQTGTEVRYARVVTKNGKRMYEFSYRVPKARGYAIPDGKNTLVMAIKGSVFADFDTKAIVRVEMQSVDLPAEASYRSVDLKLNYKPTRVADQEFTAPSDFEVTAQLLIGEVKLTAEYGDYRGLTADTARKFRSAGPPAETLPAFASPPPENATLEFNDLMTYDVIVIGSGPGGYSAAVRAGQYGLKTAIIEKDPKLGGTCLLVGCIPTKAFLHTADVWERFQHPEEDGIHCENPRLDFPLVLERKNKIVDKHSKGVEYLMKKNKVDWIKGYGRLAGPGRVEVTGRRAHADPRNPRRCAGDRFGSPHAPRPPARCPAHPHQHRNSGPDRRCPQSLAILGAGAVGVEFASCFQRFGSKVSVFEMLPRIVPVEDEEVSKELRAASRRPASASKPARAVGQHPEDRFRRALQRRRWTTEKPKQWKPKRCWSPWDASPTRKTSASKAPRVELDRGFIKVDEIQRTGEPGVYAIGDIVAGTPQLAHVATAEGMVAMAHIAGKPATPINKNRIPGAHLHRARHRQRRTDRSAGARQGLQGQDRQVPVPGQQQGVASWASTTASSRSSPMKSTAKFWASTSSARRRLS